MEPIHSLTMDSNAINMNVKAGSKVANLMNFAQKKFEVKSLLDSKLDISRP